MDIDNDLQNELTDFAKYANAEIDEQINLNFKL